MAKNLISDPVLGSLFFLVYISDLPQWLCYNVKLFPDKNSLFLTTTKPNENLMEKRIRNCFFLQRKLTQVFQVNSYMMEAVII